jgi:hypothetical protein
MLHCNKMILPALLVATAAIAAEPPPPVDLDALAVEYAALRDELFRARAKAELLGAALYKTRMTASLQYQAGRAWPLQKVTLRLDDQPVFAADAPAAGDEPLKLFDGFAVPGRHTVTLRVECGAVGSAHKGYATESTIAVDVPDGKQSRIAFVVDETGDGPQALAKKKQGTFDLRVRANIKLLEREAK